MDIHDLPILLGAGVVAGFINTLAGGGSMLTVPLLVTMGLSTPMANGTNRVAILIQNIAAIVGFSQAGVTPYRWAAKISLPAILGALAGAFCAARMDPAWLDRVFGGVLIVMAALVVFKPDVGPKERDQETAKIGIGTWLSFLGIGFWGGFAQVGVGFLFLGALVFVSSWNLVKANAIKVVVIAGYTAVSLVVYQGHGQIDWVVGFVLAAGNATGGFLASKAAVEKGSKFVRAVLVVCALAGALKLLVF